MRFTVKATRALNAAANTVWTPSSASPTSAGSMPTPTPNRAASPNLWKPSRPGCGNRVRNLQEESRLLRSLRAVSRRLVGVKFQSRTLAGRLGMPNAPLTTLLRSKSANERGCGRPRRLRAAGSGPAGPVRLVAVLWCGRRRACRPIGGAGPLGEPARELPQATRRPRTRHPQRERITLGPRPNPR
jgi:hypothetical protein